MSVGIFDQVFAYWNGNLLAENVTVKIALESQNQDVFTTVDGYAGFTPGPNKLVVSFENALSATSSGIQAWKAQMNYEIGTLRLQRGGTGEVLESEGDLRANAIDSGVGSNTSHAFEFHGAPAEWTGAI